MGVLRVSSMKTREELAASIKDIGIAEPLIVSPNADGTYHLIAGERRLRAAKLAGLKQVPVVVRQGTDALLTRKLQVAENNERDDLTPYEEALGVIEDVEQYGVKGAADIWKRSEAWISKRTAVQKYGSITKSVLEKELSGDFEVRHALNQIEAIDAEEARRLSRLLEAGPGSVSRAEVRNCLERVKLRRTQERERARAAESQRAEPKTERQQHVSRTYEVGQHVGKPHRKQSATALTVVEQHGEPVPQQGEPEAWSVDTDESLIALRRKLIEAGHTTATTVSRMIEQLRANGAEVDAGEWVLWSSFQDALLPLAAVLGDKRMEQYMKRIGLEMKRKDPQTLLAVLHGEAFDSPAAANVPPMPAGWRF